MSAEAALREGNLEKALSELQDKIRKKPADPKLRTFLFQLLSVLGQWERAFKQLTVVADLDPETIAMVQTYGPAIEAEAVRAEVFSGQRTPLLFGEPEPWMAKHLQALALDGQGKVEEAGKLRDQAFEDAPARAGTFNGEKFEWIADADPRIGPMLEVIANGRYQWVPIQRLRGLRIDDITDLRDLVWAPAYLELETGAKLAALIPTRYPGSAVIEDSDLALSKKTEWVEDNGAYRGVGQRLLATDAGEFPLLEAREVTIDTPLVHRGEGEAPAAPEGDGAGAEPSDG